MDPTYQTSYYTTTTTTDPAAAAVVGIAFLVYMIVVLAITLIMVVSLWKLFTKAGKPGWASIVPVYNTIMLLEVAGRPAWWFLLAFVPFFGIWVEIVVILDFVKSYGKSTGFGVFAIFFPYIAFPILAFSKAQYIAPAAAGRTDFMPAPEPTVHSSDQAAPVASFDQAPFGAPAQPVAPVAAPETPSVAPTANPFQSAEVPVTPAQPTTPEISSTPVAPVSPFAPVTPENPSLSQDDTNKQQ